jgi:long-chain acyl-CoA synthetase
MSGEPEPEPESGSEPPPWVAQYPDSWPETADYPELTVPEILVRRAGEFPDRTAIVFRGAEYSYADLLDSVERTAAALDGMGVEAGEHVAVCMPNCPQFTACFYAVQWLGAAVVHTSHMYTEREMARVLDRTDARTAVVADEQAGTLAGTIGDTGVERVLVTVPDRAGSGAGADPANADLVAEHGWEWFADATDTDRDPPSIRPGMDDTASLLHTGGTTGFPKSVPVTHRYWTLTTAQGEFVDLCAYREDGTVERGEQVMTGLMPMFHLNGNWTANLYGVYNGATVVLYSEFDAGRVLRDVERYGITHMHTVPTMLTAMLEHPLSGETDFSSLRHVAAASAPVPTEKKRRFEALTGAGIFELYGQTETSWTTAEPLQNRREGSCGLPIPGVTIDVADVDSGERLGPGEVGEFVVEVDDHTMDGYYDDPEETARTVRDGWIHTADLGYRDEDWFFYYVDRMDDMIVSGGHNVYPAEVEAVLYGADRLSEAAVIGLPDDYLGERVTAFVEPEAGADTEALEAELRALCEESLAEYKTPREYRFREALPRTDVGKISRAALEEAIED